MAFNGFPVGKVPLTPVPAPFFTDLLPLIRDIDELKITLYAFWFLNQQEGDFRFITEEMIRQDKIFMSGLEDNALAHLTEGLKKAVEHGIFIQAEDKAAHKVFYFLNSPRGRAAVKLVTEGSWVPGDQVPVSLDNQRPNIFRLYEEHIGPLTPIMSDTLKDAEALFPPEWIEEAVRIAVHKNVRNWRYIESILRSWLEKGRNETDRRNPQEDSRKYIEGEFADFIDH